MARGEMEVVRGKLYLEDALRSGAFRAALLVDGRAAGARARRVARLRHEVLDHAVEDQAVIVAFETKLHKITARERRLVGKELDLSHTHTHTHTHKHTKPRMQRQINT